MFDAPISPIAKIAFVAVLLAALFISFFLGRYSVNPVDLIQGLFRHFFDASSITPDNTAVYSLDRVIFNIRLPRILLVILVGAALASSGASLQGMFRNPLVSPDLLGASAGASLG
ncbi:MAG: iron ABC transporter permease, partial [Coriobacteriales bacterium]|nr:iron ABC transporter permease [Coriobacteriales bacterium]